MARLKMDKTIFIKKSRVPLHVQKSIDQILHNLEKHGRASTTNGRASRYLSFRFNKQPKIEDSIVFWWHKKYNKSFIQLSPTTKLVRINDNKVRIYRDIDEEK